MFNKKSVVETPEYLNCGVCKNDVSYGLVFPDDEHGTMCWYCVLA